MISKRNSRNDAHLPSEKLFHRIFVPSGFEVATAKTGIFDDGECGIATGPDHAKQQQFIAEQCFCLLSLASVDMPKHTVDGIVSGCSHANDVSYHIFPQPNEKTFS